jgi:hypothetical protein
VTHLFATHGKITPQQVKVTEQSVYGMHYDITQPVDVVFNTIEDLADLAEHANSPMSEQQQIDMAYVILARQPILQHGVRLWHRRLLAECTWANMLAHFREAQNDLRALPTVGEVYPQQPAPSSGECSRQEHGGIGCTTPSRVYSHPRQTHRQRSTGERATNAGIGAPSTRVSHAFSNARDDGSHARLYWSFQSKQQSHPHLLLSR